MANREFNPVVAASNEVVVVAGSCVGGATAVTKATGRRYTVAYVSTGLYRLTFADTFPSMLAFTVSLQAATPGDVKGHTVIADTISAGVIDVAVYNASDTLHDLAANEWFNFVAVFSNSSLG